MKAQVAPALALLLAIASPALAQTSGLPAVFQGGVPSGERTAQPLTLTLGDAVQRGLEHNLGVLLEEQRVQSAEGAHWRAMSGLLPDVSGSLSAAREKINLAAFGFKAPGIPVGLTRKVLRHGASRRFPFCSAERFLHRRITAGEEVA